MATPINVPEVSILWQRMLARSPSANVASSLSLCMLLVNIEVSIVGTSLISITNDLHGFSQQGWVVTGYLITYTGRCYGVDNLAWH